LFIGGICFITHTDGKTHFILGLLFDTSNTHHISGPDKAMGPACVSVSA